MWSYRIQYIIIILLRLYTKNVVYYMALRSANHSVIRVVNTTQCHMIHQLVWYGHFIFYSVYDIIHDHTRIHTAAVVK